MSKCKLINVLLGLAVMYTVSGDHWNNICLLGMLIICKLIRQASCFYLSKRKQVKSSSRIIPILFSNTKNTCKTTPDSFNYSVFCLPCISLLLCIPSSSYVQRLYIGFWKVLPTPSLTCRFTLDSGFCFYFYYVYICVFVLYIYLTSVVKLVFIL